MKTMPRLHLTSVSLAVVFLTLRCAGRETGLKEGTDGSKIPCETCETEGETIDIVNSPIPLHETPQMVLFSYEGAIDEGIRSKLTSIFPDTVRNDNGCPVGITLFVTGKKTDTCTVHRLFVRGHEIATQTLTWENPTEWNGTDWKTEIEDNRDFIQGNSSLPSHHITGFRSPLLGIGGKVQYDLLSKLDYGYDSSLLTGTDPIWPFEMKFTFQQYFNCEPRLQSQCPNMTFPGLWEVPIEQFALPPSKTCTFDECIFSISTEEAIYNLLMNNFNRHYRGKRTPLHLTLRARALDNENAMNAIARFVGEITDITGAWIVTHQQAIDWIRTPVGIKSLLDDPLWDCPDRLYHKCKSQTIAKRETGSLKGLVVDRMWLWQGIVLIAAFVFLLYYDKRQDG